MKLRNYTALALLVGGLATTQSYAEGFDRELLTLTQIRRLAPPFPCKVLPTWRQEGSRKTLRHAVVQGMTSFGTVTLSHHLTSYMPYHLRQEAFALAEAHWQLQRYQKLGICSPK